MKGPARKKKNEKESHDIPVVMQDSSEKKAAERGGEI